MSFESLTSHEIDEIEKRAALATPGPWVPVLETRGATGGGSCIQVAPETAEVDDELYISRFVAGADIRSPNIQLDADLDFIAYARSDIPRLIAEVRRLREALRDAGV
ncbi:hypothetical protein [Kitasatospora sp. NPDC004289]